MAKTASKKKTTAKILCRVSCFSLFKGLFGKGIEEFFLFFFAMFFCLLYHIILTPFCRHPPPPLADSGLLLDQGGENRVIIWSSVFPALVKAG